MLDISEFISKDKSMLIAPAGFGKTYTIAECLKNTKVARKQLVLTHTHAGISSIKEKIKKEDIPNSFYEVETITSFAQKYVLSFYTGTDIPEQENSKLYYSFILEKAIALFKLKPIKQIISKSYGGLYIDEYQDCTVKQHELVQILSELFPTHILGDFLQGIFGFNGEKLVDMLSQTEMKEFSDYKYELDKPQRWLNGNNVLLGEDLKNIREALIKKEEIDLSKYTSIKVNVCKDFYRTHYSTILKLLTTESSLLIIDPISTNINSRIKFIQQFKNIPRLIESIDDKEFYTLAKECDLATKENVVINLIGLCYRLFNDTGVKIWFNPHGFKRKILESDKALLRPIELKIKSIEKELSFSTISGILKDIKNLPGIKCYRKELFNSLCKALEEAECQNISVFESMTNKRNLIRRVGRKIYGRCIGTTLLTKGLEFDTVAIINAHKFDSPKHLYVALTRASKRVIIFTDKMKLNPYN